MFPAFVAPTSRPYISPSCSAFVQEAHCRSWPGLQAVKKSRPHRAWLSEDMRRMNDNPRESHVTVGQLPAFEGAGADVGHEFVWGESIMDDVKWKRVEQLDGLPRELVELHNELQGALDTKQDTDRVQHLGENVYVQYNKWSLDRDAAKGSPATITREESRSVVHHALDALRSEFAVCVTGQPGIGKTRGCMMYAIQTLLHRGAAVLYVGYKSKGMLMFLPGDDSKYRVWSGSSDQFGLTALLRDNRVVAVIDPPEEGSYSSMGACRILKFVSNNAEMHFRNWDKDGILLVTFMPTMKQVVVMTPILWNDATSPHPWQHGKFNTLEDKMVEIERRIELVGPIPRLVFNSKLFIQAVQRCEQGAEEAAMTVSDRNIFKALRGRYRALIEKYPASASSSLFFLGLNNVAHKTWEERAFYRPEFQLTPIALMLLRDRLTQFISELRADEFEEFAFDWLCEQDGVTPEFQLREIGSEAAAIERIATLRKEELRVYKPASGQFSFIDYATSSMTWYNAKSGSTERKAYNVSVKGANDFLEKLERTMREKFGDDLVEDMLAVEQPVLIVLANGPGVPKLTKEKEPRKFFERQVRLEVRNLKELSRQHLEDRVYRTQQLFEDLQERLA